MRLELSYTAGVTVANVADLELTIVRLPWQRGKPWSVRFRHERHAENDFPKAYLEACLDATLDPLRAVVALAVIEESLAAAETVLKSETDSASVDERIRSCSRNLF